LAVPAIRCDPGEEAEERGRKKPREAHEPGLGRRVRHGEDEQRVSNRRRRGAGGRKEPPRLEQHEIAVSPQRNRAHSPSVSRVSEAEGDSGESRPIGESGTEEAVSLVENLELRHPDPRNGPRLASGSSRTGRTASTGSAPARCTRVAPSAE